MDFNTMILALREAFQEDQNTTGTNNCDSLIWWLLVHNAEI